MLASALGFPNNFRAESLAAIQRLRTSLGDIDDSIEATRLAIAVGKALLTERVHLFNEFFWRCPKSFMASSIC
jgi:hypothetical protein